MPHGMGETLRVGSYDKIKVLRAGCDSNVLADQVRRFLMH